MILAYVSIRVCDCGGAVGTIFEILVADLVGVLLHLINTRQANLISQYKDTSYPPLILRERVTDFSLRWKPDNRKIRLCLDGVGLRSKEVGRWAQLNARDEQHK